MREGQLRSVRLERGLTQEALAHLAGVTLPTVARLEQGIHWQVRARTAEALAHVLGVRVDRFAHQEDPDG